jgi:cystathionine beta-lyase family protein involved in aluminum resistance
MYYGYDISDYTADLAKKAESDCAEIFKKIDENALFCSAKVLRAFQSRKEPPRRIS